MKLTTQSHYTENRIERAVRERYSPLPQLTMDVLVDHLNAFRVGELRGAARIWEIMVERDGELACNIDKRAADTARLEWEVYTTDESSAANAHAEALRYLYDHLRATAVLDQNDRGGIRTLIRQMLQSHAHRYSGHELVVRVDNAAKKQITLEARACPVWFFESRRGRLAWLPDDFSVQGLPMEEGQWLTTVGRGYMRQCSVAYVAKWEPVAAWLLYASRFGLPGVHGKTDAAKDSKEWDDFAAALQEFANDWVTLTNRSAEISLVETKGGGSSSLPFPPLIEMADRLYAKLFRGADLATQSAGNDSTGASLQVDEKDAILADDAEFINEALNDQIDRPFLQYLFGEEPLAYFRLVPPKRIGADSDRASLEFLISNGCKVAKQTAMERFGWPEAQDDQEALDAPEPAPQPAGPGGKPAATDPEVDDEALDNSKGVDDLTARSGPVLASALEADLAPLLRRLAAIEGIQDPEIRRARLHGLVAEMDGLSRDILAAPESAKVLEQINGAAVANGIQRDRTK